MRSPGPSISTRTVTVRNGHLALVGAGATSWFHGRSPRSGSQSHRRWTSVSPTFGRQFPRLTFSRQWLIDVVDHTAKVARLRQHQCCAKASLHERGAYFATGQSAGYLRIEERELEAFSLGSVSYPPVQPVAFFCCVRRAAIGATMERKRPGVAWVASSLRWALKKSAGQPSYWSPQ